MIPVEAKRLSMVGGVVNLINVNERFNDMVTVSQWIDGFSLFLIFQISSRVLRDSTTHSVRPSVDWLVGWSIGRLVTLNSF